MLSRHFWNDSRREKYENAAMKERQLSLLQLENMVQDAAKSNREVAEVLNRAKQQMEVGRERELLSFVLTILENGIFLVAIITEQWRLGMVEAA